MRREVSCDLLMIVSVDRNQDDLGPIRCRLDIGGRQFDRGKVLRTSVNVNAFGGADANDLLLVLVIGANADALSTQLGEEAFSAHTDADHGPHVIFRNCHLRPLAGKSRRRPKSSKSISAAPISNSVRS